MLRFAHLADLHLDTPFRGLGRVAETVQASLREASLQAWDRAVEVCLREGVEFVLVAGDVYDQDEAGLRAQIRFLRGLERLTRAGVAVFVVHGNHDPQGGRWSAVRHWPAGVTVFGAAGVEVAPVERDGQVRALVHGMSYPERHVRENLAARFRRREDPVYQIGLLHASVGEHPAHAPYAACSLDDLRASGLDYWALGHVHTRQVVCPAFPAVVYPGNLQARHPGEEGPRGFCVVEAERGATPRLTFHPTDLWRFVTLRLDLGREPAASVDELLARLVTASLAAKEQGGLVASAEISGPTPLHSELRRRDIQEELLRQLRDEAEGAPDLWWDAVRVQTRPPVDRAQRLAAGDFVADLLQGSAERRAGAREQVALLLAEMRRRPDFAAIQHEVDWAALTEAAEALWADAEQFAFDLLAPQAGSA